MHVFATAREPLAEATFTNISSHINHLVIYVNNNSWNQIREATGREVLELLSSIPSRRIRQAVDLAKLDRSRGAARRQLADYESAVQEAGEQAEAKIREAQYSF